MITRLKLLENVFFSDMLLELYSLLWVEQCSNVLGFTKV